MNTSTGGRSHKLNRVDPSEKPIRCNITTVMAWVRGEVSANVCEESATDPYVSILDIIL
jgi:hypothetical protein